MLTVSREICFPAAITNHFEALATLPLEYLWRHVFGISLAWIFPRTNVSVNTAHSCVFFSSGYKRFFLKTSIKDPWHHALQTRFPCLSSSSQTIKSNQMFLMYIKCLYTNMENVLSYDYIWSLHMIYLSFDYLWCNISKLFINSNWIQRSLNNQRCLIWCPNWKYLKFALF